MKPFDPGRFLSRKFLAWAVITGLATWGLLAGKLDSDAWARTVIWTTAMYTGFNVLQKLWTGGGDS